MGQDRPWVNCEGPPAGPSKVAVLSRWITKDVTSIFVFMTFRPWKAVQKVYWFFGGWSNGLTLIINSQLLHCVHKLWSELICCPFVYFAAFQKLGNDMESVRVFFFEFISPKCQGCIYLEDGWLDGSKNVVELQLAPSLFEFNLVGSMGAKHHGAR